MKIWFITIGEPIPHDKNNLRLHRTGLLTKLISEKTMHEVTWWTSDFNHFTKEHIFNRDMHFFVNERLKIVALHGKGYSRNVSFDRIIDHRQIAAKFRNLSLFENKPDIIVASFPTLELCEAALEYGKSKNIPVFIDYRDMWPEVFIDYSPTIFRSLVSIFLKKLSLRTNQVFANCNGIIGITDEFLQIALSKAKRFKTDFDTCFPLAYAIDQVSDVEIGNANNYFEKILSDDSLLRITFLGTLGHQFDLKTIVKAIELLNNQGIYDFEFVLCGSGDFESELKRVSKNLKGLKLPGYISSSKIRSLLLKSDIGLCPYHTSKAFMNSIPGKAIEYMSAGLPILTTLKDGKLGKYLNQNGFGYYYSHGEPESLANVVISLLAQKESLSSYKKKIIQLFYNDFSADIVYMQYLSHLENSYSKILDS
jgi:glycosyltransferase involved in cell wall biosynthesis